MGVDLILAGVIGAAFYGGFKVGNKFTSLSAAWEHFKDKVTK